MPWNEISVILTRSWTGSSPGSPWTTPCVRGDTFVGHSHVLSCFSAASVAEAVKRFLQKKYWIRLSPLCRLLEVFTQLLHPDDSKGGEGREAQPLGGGGCGGGAAAKSGDCDSFCWGAQYI